MQNLRLKSQSIDAIAAVAEESKIVAEETENKVDELRTVATVEQSIWALLSSAGTKLKNATTVFIPLDLVIPAFTLAKLKVASSAAGTLEVLLFTMNSDGTLNHNRTITQSVETGDNIITFLTEADTVIGFYSQDGAITYSASGSEKIPIYKAVYANIGPSTAITFLADQEWHFDLSYQIVRSRPSNVATVKQDGTGKYTDIITAINQESENTPIFVFPGIYEQDMTACLKKRIILIGTDRNSCIIRDTDGRYGHHALYISCGYFENLTIEEPYISGVSQEIGASDLGAYAVHIDNDSDYGVDRTTEFHHCTITSDFFPAVGLGMRKDATFIFDNCLLVNSQIVGRGEYSDQGSLGALYFHDSNGAHGPQYITVKNCVLKSKLKNAMCPYQVNRTPQENRVYCEFVSNVLYSEIGHLEDTVWFRRDPFNPETGIFSLVVGYGNSISTLNN